MAFGVQIVLFLLGVAIFANYAWHIFGANDKDWHEAKSGDVEKDHEDR
jgi:hypothetical protein